MIKETGGEKNFRLSEKRGSTFALNGWGRISSWKRALSLRKKPFRRQHCHLCKGLTGKKNPASDPSRGTGGSRKKGHEGEGKKFEKKKFEGKGIRCHDRRRKRRRGLQRKKMESGTGRTLP